MSSSPEARRQERLPIVVAIPAVRASECHRATFSLPACPAASSTSVPRRHTTRGLPSVPAQSPGPVPSQRTSCCQPDPGSSFTVDPKQHSWTGRLHATSILPRRVSTPVANGPSVACSPDSDSLAPKGTSDWFLATRLRVLSERIHSAAEQIVPGHLAGQALTSGPARASGRALPGTAECGAARSVHLVRSLPKPVSPTDDLRVQARDFVFVLCSAIASEALYGISPK